MNSEELNRAHQRIAELEGMLRNPVEPKPVPWILHVVGALAIIFAFVAAFAPPPKVKRVEKVNWVKAPEVVPAGSLVLATEDAPVFAKIGDTSYAFVLGFRHGVDDACVVAFDRSTWKEAWRSAPLVAEGRNRGHLTATGDAVVFAARSFVILDGRSGEAKRDEVLGFPARRVYVDPLDKDWVIVGQGGVGSAATHAEAFDVKTGERRLQAEARQPLCSADRTRMCIEPAPNPPAAVKKLYPNSDYVSMVHQGTDSFLLVYDRVGGGPGSLEAAMLLDGEKVVWHGLLAPDRKWAPWPNTVPEGHLEFANRRILYSYLMPDGQQRITARELLTGTPLYDEAIPGIGYGSKIGSFAAEGDEAVLVANQSLIVIDAKDGRIKKRITTF